MSGAEAKRLSNKIYAYIFEDRFFSNLDKHNRLLSVGEWPFFGASNPIDHSKTNLKTQSIFQSSFKSLSSGAASVAEF